jgi:hypothetical protein
MIRFILLMLILFSLVAGSCSKRQKKMEHSNLIPEKELVAILTDIHIADGILSLPKIHIWFTSLDSVSSYNHIIEEHGYSKETMDKTMKYYFIKKPKELIKIYDQVLGILSERESLIAKEIVLAEGRIANVWTSPEFYSFPDPSGTDSASFAITLKRPGFYSLSFSATLFPDDQSLNPRMTVYSCHPDSIDTGKRNYLNIMSYIKDGQPHKYALPLTVPENSPLYFRGWFYNFDNYPDEWEKHLVIENISLTNTSSALR